MSPWTYYWISVAVLAVLLFWPVSKLVWVLSVRRLERKLGQPLSEPERLGQRNRAWLLAIVLCGIFSALFNYQILDMASHG
jgi:divalent metal cation (Fe/Co/Zn/Cd) transporter